MVPLESQMAVENLHPVNNSLKRIILSLLEISEGLHLNVMGVLLLRQCPLPAVAKLEKASLEVCRRLPKQTIRGSQWKAEFYVQNYDAITQLLLAPPVYTNTCSWECHNISKCITQ
ncbi:hypothetical protein E2320_013516 [Naja naja]|nr:hypothetical protein E2320_013516 [Naja naja]